MSEEVKTPEEEAKATEEETARVAAEEAKATEEETARVAAEEAKATEEETARVAAEEAGGGPLEITLEEYESLDRAGLQSLCQAKRGRAYAGASVYGDKVVI